MAKKIQSAMFDDYSDNYLGENKYYTCQKTSNYSTFNSIVNLEMANLKRKN